MVSRAERGAFADWFWTIDRYFLAAFIVLMGIGIMLSFAASPAVAERDQVSTASTSSGVTRYSLCRPS